MRNILDSTRIALAVSQCKPNIQNQFLEEYQNEMDVSVMIKKYTKILNQNEQAVEKIIEDSQALSVTIISIFDDIYPALLKEINDPPLILYTIGRIELFKKTSIVAIVGTRESTTYGNLIAIQFAKELCSYGIVVISGLADGIDVAAHKGALEAGDTIAVLGSGIDIIYPSINKPIYSKMYKHGLVVSEYPPGYPASKYTFPKRNRIIAGISRGVLIVESKERGGSLITAEYALSNNREVFAVPGKIGDENSIGPNMLIQKGAKLVLNVQDIIEEFNWMIPEKQTKSEIKFKMDKNEESIYGMLSLEAMYIDDISSKSGLSITKTMTILSFLEMQNLVKQVPGKRYVRS
ncbi:MAG: DNA protecting protein DprA [Candidatus Margulisbacteria bacterium GWF2_35_9]|nr:MAG: DNA protecting protein DprA [Candidatus Margulisbacteria bacterium GWF2_35_9]